MRIRIVLYILVLFPILQAQQVSSEIQDPDASFEYARNLANDEDVDHAIKVCEAIIEKYPEYHDVVIYLAGLKARIGDLEVAHELVMPLLEIEPPLQDAYLLQTRLFFWQNKWRALEQSAMRSLELFPDHSELKYLLALSLYKTGRPESALSQLATISQSDPVYSRAEALKQTIYGETDFPAVFTRYNFDYFKMPYTRSWHQLTAGLLYPLDRIKLSPYVKAGHAINNSADFLTTSAVQVNLDGYINFTDSSYALLGYGIGSGDFLPGHRAIAHYWQALPAAWTVSAGARYFYFDQHFIFYALGLEKYLGNYWLNLNGYFFMKDYGMSAATYFTARRYFDSREHHVDLTAGYGTSPDEPITALYDLQRLNAFTTRVSYNRRLGKRSVIGAGLGYMYEEYREQIFRNRFSGFLSYSLKLP
ncbi:MAG TPA: YaiO family outer membrane beta-barrel protein [Bacteroidales bacterium]|nr:YaiO family outer membrane beta-barrel protein [Bacteroidales bacterium]